MLLDVSAKLLVKPVELYTQARRELAKLTADTSAGQDDAGKTPPAGSADKTLRGQGTGGRAYWKVGAILRKKKSFLGGVSFAHGAPHVITELQDT